ncbi:MAG: hypothetical protein ACP5HD_09750, partial [Thermoproteus sp.]
MAAYAVTAISSTMYRFGDKRWGLIGAGRHKVLIKDHCSYVALSAEEKRRFLRALEEDEEFRLAVAGLLGLDEILKELRRLREDFMTFVKMEEERWKENEKRWEENERRWREWFETWKKFLEENERRWQENEKRWEENNKRWEENWRRWEENEKRWEEQFRFNNWLRSALLEIRDALGGGFEYFAARVVEGLLRERGVECRMRVNVTLPVDGFKEVDLFCPQPLVVGEVSVSVRSVEEAEGLLEQLRRSVEAAERFVGSRAYLKVVAVEFAPKDAAE